MILVGLKETTVFKVQTAKPLHRKGVYEYNTELCVGIQNINR